MWTMDAQKGDEMVYDSPEKEYFTLELFFEFFFMCVPFAMVLLSPAYELQQWKHSLNAKRFRWEMLQNMATQINIKFFHRQTRTREIVTQNVFEQIDMTDDVKH